MATGARYTIVDTIEAGDGAYWEVRYFHTDCGGEVCRHNPEHPILAGQECIEVIRRQRQNDGSKIGKPSMRYCLDHASEHIEQIRKLEANRAAKGHHS